MYQIGRSTTRILLRTIHSTRPRLLHATSVTGPICPIHPHPFITVIHPTQRTMSTLTARQPHSNATDSTDASTQPPSSSGTKNAPHSQRVFSSSSSSSSSSSDSDSKSSSSSQQEDSSSNDSNDDSDSSSSQKSWWQRWTHELPMPEKFTPAWYKEMAIIFTVFGVTGSSSMYFVKPLVKNVIGVDGTMMQGPWSYRLACLGLMMPCYSLMLVGYGTLAGRHHYFRRQALKMWGRILPLHKLGITARPAPIAKAAKKTDATKPSA